MKYIKTYEHIINDPKIGEYYLYRGYRVIIPVKVINLDNWINPIHVETIDGSKPHVTKDELIRKMLPDEIKDYEYQKSHPKKVKYPKFKKGDYIIVYNDQLEIYHKIMKIESIIEKDVYECSFLNKEDGIEYAEKFDDEYGEIFAEDIIRKLTPSEIEFETNIKNYNL